MGGIKAFFDSILNKGKKKKPTKSVPVGKPYTYIFKGEQAWEAAAGEYRRLMGKSEEAELTEEEKKKIYDYTMMPLAYFFGWLCERDLIGEGFGNEFGETDQAKLTEEVKQGKITPLEALAGFGHYFSYEWIKEEAKYFFRSYFDSKFSERDSFKDEDIYLYDYYECIGEPEDRYYCMEYSAEVQKKMDQRLDERYAKSNACVTWEDIRDNYYSDEEDDEHVVTLHSTFFNKDLNVFRCGRIQKGEFPEDYAQKCLKSLEEMPQKEWHRLERWLVECYGGELEDLKMNHFHAYDLNIYEPQEEGDLAFMISGEADYEEEHGISFTIRNGILLDWNYANESGDPYDDDVLIARYERYSYGRDLKTGAKEIDFEQITEQKDLDALVTEGKLIRTLLVPEWLGGADTDENKVYVTPMTLVQIEKIQRRLKMIRAYALTVLPEWEFHVEVKAKYCENTDGTNPLVPMCITYSRPNPNPEMKLTIKMDAAIWE